MREAGSGPDWVLCENVVGILQHVEGCQQDGPPEECAGCYWEREVILGFQARFPHVSWRVLNAADYGVPQCRKRVFLAAGPKPYPWPQPTHTRDNLLHDKWVSGKYWTRHGLPRPCSPTQDESSAMRLRVTLATAPPDVGAKAWVSIRDATGLGYPIRNQASVQMLPQHLPDELSATISTKGTIYAERDVQEVSGYNPHYHERLLSGEGTLDRARPDLIERVRQGLFRQFKPQEVGVLDLFGDDVVVGSQGKGVDPVIESEGRRRLTHVENASLQGFPVGYPFMGNSQDKYRQVGNAVPPPVAEALGRAVASLYEHER